ncbi:methyl-accepting chemotaxis protein [Vibrio coralliilyticus]|uniref:methyl-accepting chemotaxis protein n=1 Tax=Vibrio coralliilyticus TaxID=190893 RepID=UPI0039170A39
MSLSLYKKLLLLMAVVVSIITLTLSTTSYSHFSQHIEEQTQRSISLYSTLINSQISSWLQSQTQEIKALHNSITKLENSASIPTYLNQATQSSDFFSTYFATADKDMYRVSGLNTVPNYNPLKRPWYKRAQSTSDQLVMTDPFVGPRSGKLTVTIAKALVSNGLVKGVVGGSLPLENISKQVSDLSLPGQGFAILLSDKGLVLAHPDKELWGKNWDEISEGLKIEELPLESESSLVERTIDGKSYLIGASTLSQTGWRLLVVGDKSVLYSPVKHNLKVQSLLSSIILIVVLTLSYFMIKFLFRGVSEVVSALKQISTGEGDLTKRINVKSKDEVGVLAENFNDFVVKLQTMLVDIRDVGLQINTFASTASQQSRQLSRQSADQQQELALVATASTEMATATSEISLVCEQSAEQTSIAYRQIEKGQLLAKDSKSIVEELSNTVNTTSETIKTLDNKSREISSIIETIEAIASQTNLLALNAAIEAARAGDQGRGFAVVADEVRLLSQKTHQSTEKIESIITSLQETAFKAVKEMEHCHSLAEGSYKSSEAGNVILEEIQKNIQIVNDTSDQIAVSLEEQTLVTKEISQNSEKIQLLSENVANQASESAAHSDALAQLSIALDKQVGRFKL